MGYSVNVFGLKYSYEYSYEIDELSEELNTFVEQYVKHNLKITIESMVAWILFSFAVKLGKVDKNGCLEVAYELKKKINEIINEE